MTAWIFATAVQPNVKAITDKGREVPLFCYEALALPTNGQVLAISTNEERRVFFRRAEQHFLTNTRQQVSELHRIAEPHPVGNCHGWVFACGRFGIESADMAAILADNGYVAVDGARDGDLALYRKGNEIIHSGSMCAVESNGQLLVESKWGPFGVFRHAVNEHPFGGRCTFYRTERGGHTMEIRQVSE